MARARSGRLTPTGLAWVAVVMGACAQADPGAIGTDLGEDLRPGLADLGPGVDLATAPCGDGVCAAADGEACDTCPVDCGPCSACPVGLGDCNAMRLDGCETDLTSAENCGACGMSCVAAGGGNDCVLTGTTYLCQPSCDATHEDCDGDPANGCETDLTTPLHCGACDVKCANPNGSILCTTAGAGWFCAPGCAPGWDVCGKPEDGCQTQTATDVDSCGACGRSCSTLNASQRDCFAGACAPTCAAPWSDCSQPASPGADDGCETNGTQDPGEPDNACDGQRLTVPEASFVDRTTNRILPNADLDTFTVDFIEASHLCFPGSSQPYHARVLLTQPESLGYQLAYNLQNNCNNTWSKLGNALCINWGGTCGSSDDVTVHFQVGAPAGVASCVPYRLYVEYCDGPCPGC